MTWKPIETAPKDGTPIQAEIPGHGSDNVIEWMGGLYDSNGDSCGGWAFTHEEQEPPPCWTDGICWQVNEDGVPSVQPVRWRPLPPPPETEA
jgi:hypothetical protein